jgi:hypothetical protein
MVDTGKLVLKLVCMPRNSNMNNLDRMITDLEVVPVQYEGSLMMVV